MTGSLSEGAPDAIEKYNLILKHLELKGYDLSVLFPPLPSDASFDRVGVASKLLDGYIAEDVESSERERSNAHSQPKVVIGNLNGLDELKDLGRTIRENIAEALGVAESLGKIKIKVDVSNRHSPVESEPAEPKEQEAPTPMPDMSRQTTF